MNYRSWLLILSFFIGVIIANLAKGHVLLNVIPLLQCKSGLDIKEDLFTYFWYVLRMRGRIVVVLWLLQKSFRNKQLGKVILSHAVGILIAMGYGVISTAFIMSDGIHALLRAICTFFPHGVCYLYACNLWMKAAREGDEVVYPYGKREIVTRLFQRRYMWKILFFLLIGVLSEGLFSVFVQKILKII